MGYRALADVVLVLHLCFIGFVALGALLALRRRWVAVVHLPAALWGVVVELFGLVCPLTPLENALRRAAGDAGFSGGFIAHYITPIVYPPGLSEGGRFLLAFLAVAINALVYAIVWRRYIRG